MANRYWVGGAGTWNSTTTTNWSATSGGGGGASAPTSADNVIFDSASNATAYAVTLGANAFCRDVTIAGPLVGNVTITFATSLLNCYGSLTTAATGVVFSATGSSSLVLNATTTGNTITTNGVSLNALSVIPNSATGGWTLGSAITFTGTFSLQAGSFNTGNYSVTCANFSGSNTAVRSLTLGTSTITLDNASPWTFTTTTNLTFNAGTSTITCSNANPVFAGGGLTYNNVNFTSAGTGTTTIQGANTFANLNQTSTTSAIRVVVFSANQTVTGTLTLGAANTAVLRAIVRSDGIGTQRTLTVATIATLADVDFQDIVAAGASGTWSGTRLGNCTNNSNITFGAGKTVYWNLAGAQNWNATGWAASSGASPAVNNFPLAQDTAVFDNTGAVTGTITIQTTWMLPAINITKTGAMTLANGTQTPRIFGGVILQAATVTTGTGTWAYAAYGVTSTFTSNGATFTPPLTINAPTGGITLADAFTQPSTVTTTLTAGTLDLASYTLTTGLFASNNSNTRTLAFGTGKIVLTGTSAALWSTSTATNLTVTGTSPLIQLTTNATTGARTITMGAAGEANAISLDVTAGSDTITLSPTSGAYKNLTFVGFTGIINFNNSINIFGNFDTGGASSMIGASSPGFTATSGTKTVKLNGLSFPVNTSFNGVGGAWSLQDAFSVTGTLTLTNGTLQLKSGATSTVGAFATSGTNQKYLQSTTPGSQATISDASGVNSVSYLTIQDIYATGGATWDAFYYNGNLDNGNNTNWIFGESPAYGAEYEYKLRSFTEPRRF